MAAWLPSQVSGDQNEAKCMPLFDFPLGYINGALNGRKVQMLVDSACSFTTIDVSLWEEMPHRPSLKKFKTEVATVNGMKLHVLGYCAVQMTIEDIGPFDYEVLVATIGKGEAIFGYNLMKYFEATLDIGQDKVVIAGRSYPYGPCVGRRVALLRCNRAVTIQPQESRRVEVSIDGGWEDETVGLVSPNAFLTPMSGKKGLMLNPGVVQPKLKKTEVLITNLSNQPRRLPQAYDLGTVESIDQVIPFSEVKPASQPRPASVARVMAAVSRGQPPASVPEEQSESPPEMSPLPAAAGGEVPGDNTPLRDDDLGAVGGLPASPELDEFVRILQNPSPEPLPAHLQPLMDGLSPELTEKERGQVKALLLEFQDVFTGPDGKLGHTDLVKHCIDTGDNAPVKQPFRRAPMASRVIQEEEVKKMLEQGVIEPSTSSWASPVVLVRKKDGTYRFCVDYRRLNDLTKKDAYPLPRLDDSIEAMGGAQWFSTLDLHSGYWQVEMEEADKEKTAFVTRMGLYQFRVMPFGLTNAPATFERLMELVLKGLQWEQLQVYLDDIVVFGVCFLVALFNLAQVFLRFRKAKLKMKVKKCKLFQRAVEFLGHIVSKDGVKCDPAKIEVVKNWPHPTSVTEVRSFLGFATYYRRFIPHFSTVASSLTALTRKDEPFVWTDEREMAFRRLKESLITAPVLAYPLPQGQLILDTDASNTGIGAVLSQEQDGQEKVIGYASKTLSKSERAYCTTYKELLAVVKFCKHFKSYVWGQPLIVRTDHASLTWLKNFKEPEGMLARWIATLDSYNIVQIVHRPGARHVNADVLSRMVPTRPCPRKDCPCCKGLQELKAQKAKEEEEKAAKKRMKKARKTAPRQVKKADPPAFGKSGDKVYVYNRCTQTEELVPKTYPARHSYPAIMVAYSSKAVATNIASEGVEEMSQTDLQKAPGKPRSHTSQAGLQFSVRRVHRHLRRGRYAAEIGASASVYLAAVLEYVAAEVLGLAGQCAYDHKQTRINACHLQLVASYDKELTKLLSRVATDKGEYLPAEMLEKAATLGPGQELGSTPEESSMPVEETPVEETSTGHVTASDGEETLPKGRLPPEEPMKLPRSKVPKKPDGYQNRSRRRQKPKYPVPVTEKHDKKQKKKQQNVAKLAESKGSDEGSSLKEPEISLDPLPEPSEEKPCKCCRAKAAEKQQTATEQAGALFEEWVKKYDAEYWQKSQENDPEIHAMIQLLLTYTSRPEWKEVSSHSAELKAYWTMWTKMRLQNGILWRCEEVLQDDKVLRRLWRVVVPASLRTEIMELVHGHKTSGHLGISKTYARLKQRCYWPGCKADVARWCKGCHVCALIKSGGEKRKAPLIQQLSGAPMERVAADLVGPLPETKAGFKYMLVLQDYFTKWLEVFPISSKETTEVADKLVEVVTRYGIPRQFHTDQGGEFISHCIEEMCKLLDITKTRTTPYSPSSDGLVERVNRTVQNMLRAFVNEYRDDWDEAIPFLLMAYRSTEQESTKCTPNLMMLGREIETPVDVQFLPDPHSPAEVRCPVDYVDWLRDVLRRTHTIARQNLKKAATRQKRNYDQNAHARGFRVGQWVYLKDFVGSQVKLGLRWKGPYLIVKVRSDVTMAIQQTYGSKVKNVHINHLKHCEGPHPGNWELPDVPDEVDPESVLDEPGLEQLFATPGVNTVDPSNSEVVSLAEEVDDREPEDLAEDLLTPGVSTSDAVVEETCVQLIADSPPDASLEETEPEAVQDKPVKTTRSGRVVRPPDRFQDM